MRARRLLREPVEPHTLIRARRPLRRVLAVAKEVVRVTPLEVGDVLTLGRQLGRELLDRVEHPEAQLRVAARVGPQQ